MKRITKQRRYAFNNPVRFVGEPVAAVAAIDRHTAEEALRYALSLPVTAVVSGIDTMEWLQKNAKAAASFKPFAPKEMAELEQRCSPKKEYEYYRRWAYYDGGPPGACYA